MELPNVHWIDISFVRFIVKYVYDLRVGNLFVVAVGGGVVFFGISLLCVLCEGKLQCWWRVRLHRKQREQEAAERTQQESTIEFNDLTKRNSKLERGNRELREYVGGLKNRIFLLQEAITDLNERMPRYCYHCGEELDDDDQ